MDATLSFSATVLALISLCLVYTLSLAIYRLTLHPLARFPGPKLAAATWLYEFWHDVRAGGGLYIWDIERMHARYGPIVRINPEELHIVDPAFHETIYAGATQARDKWAAVEGAAQSFGAIGHTPSHELHRVRRDSVSPFFSKRSVQGREGGLKRKVERLVSRLRGFVDGATDRRQPVNLTVAYIALCMDVITEYAFGTEYGLLRADDFTESWKNTIMSIVSSVGMLTHLPWIPALMKSLPEKWQRAAAPDLALLFDYEQQVRRQVGRVLDRQPPFDKERDSGPTIFEVLRDDPRLPAKEKELGRLTDEGNVLLIAATETPGKVLAILTYHLLANPDKLQRLRDELGSCDSADSRSLAQLEALPYLSAVVREGLRLHGGVVNRTKRLAPHQALTYVDKSSDTTWVIPPNTPMSCSVYFLHYHPEVFPEPYEFRPERWLDASEADRKRMDAHYVPFGRGTRSCLGYNLGTAMVYLTLARVMTAFDMELFETGRRDVDLERDWLIPQPWKDSVGVRVRVVSENLG